MLLVNIGALEREIDEAGDDVAVPDRNLPQQQRHARGRLQQLERLAHALVGLVDLVEEQEARNVQLFELAQDQLQLRNFLLVRLAHHDRGIDRRQHRAHVVDEFDRTGAIDECVAVAHEIGGGDRSLDAHLVMARFLAGVADRGARLDRALALDRAGAGENRFEQCCLAALERAHQRDAPGTLLVPLGAVPFCPISDLPCRPGVGPSRPLSTVSSQAGRRLARVDFGGIRVTIAARQSSGRRRRAHRRVFSTKPLRLIPGNLSARYRRHRSAPSDR